MISPIYDVVYLDREKEEKKGKVSAFGMVA